MSFSLTLAAALTLTAHAPIQTADPVPVAATNSPTGLNLTVNRNPQPYLGVRLAPVGAAVAAHLPDHLGAAVILTDVMADSPAEKAGLLVHDVVYAVEEDSDVTVKGLIERISSKKVGDVLVLDVTRKGRSSRVTATLGETRHGYFPTMVPNVTGRFFGGKEGQVPYTDVWPRLGVTPDGGVMVQKEAQGDWLKTSKKLAEDANALNHFLQSGRHAVGLNEAMAGTSGRYYRELESLRQSYAAPQAKSEGLEGRVDELEGKLDAMHKLLKELASRAN